MEEESLNNELNKRSKPSVPKDFFEDFQNKLANSIDGYEPNDLLDESALDFLVKTKKPNVPQGYFETSKESTLNRVKGGEIITLKPRKFSYFVYAVAAVLILGLMVIPFFNRDQTDENILADTVIEKDSASIEEELEIEEMNDYLAYIDESTLFDYYIEESETMDEETTSSEYTVEELSEEDEAILDYLGEDFEDIYFDL